MSSIGSTIPPPQHCDIAILTVIEVEHRHMLKAFGLSGQAGKPINGKFYWETTVYSRCMQQNLSIVIGNVAQAGLVETALRTVRFLHDFRPTMLVLAGIAAGSKEHYRIGDVVWPRIILDLAQSEEHPKGVRKFRPKHHEPRAEVRQMLQTWVREQADLAKYTKTIHGTKLVPPPGRENEFAQSVAENPNAEDCVIACGNILVRNPKMFKKLQSYDPQTRAFEMESVGMVQAINDTRPNVAWLQVRGISDFGDHLKHDGWQPYAAASAAALVRLFAEQCFDPRLISGWQPNEIGAPAGSTLAYLPNTARPYGVATFSAVSGPSPSSIPLIKEFEELIKGWKCKRDSAVSKKLLELPTRIDFVALPPISKAHILRVAGKIVLDCDGDVAAAEVLFAQADTFTGPSRLHQALLTARKSGPKKGAEDLKNPSTLEEWNHLMLFQVQAGDTDGMLRQWESPPDGVGPDTESRRLHILALISKRRISEARTEFSKISSKEPFAIRILAPLLEYFQAVSTAAPEPAFRMSPDPIPMEFVKQDSDSLSALDRAAAGFAEILRDLAPGTETYFETRCWRLAAIANNATRRAEAQQTCVDILAETPGDAQVLAWASAREYAVDKEGGLAALAAKLGLKL